MISDFTEHKGESGKQRKLQSNLERAVEGNGHIEVDAEQYEEKGSRHEKAEPSACRGNLSGGGKFRKKEKGGKRHGCSRKEHQQRVTEKNYDSGNEECQTCDECCRKTDRVVRRNSFYAVFRNEQQRRQAPKGTDSIQNLRQRNDEGITEIADILFIRCQQADCPENGEQKRECQNRQRIYFDFAFHDL